MNESGVPYHCKTKTLPSLQYMEIWRIVWCLFKMIKRKTKRRPYVRSAYFKGDKIFFDYFWEHLKNKHLGDRVRRLRFFECTIELIKNSRVKPSLKVQDKLGKEKLYRFLGEAQGELFAIQIKEDLKRGQKFLVSIFPLRK